MASRRQVFDKLESSWVRLSDAYDYADDVCVGDYSGEGIPSGSVKQCEAALRRVRSAADAFNKKLSRVPTTGLTGKKRRKR